MVDQVIDNEGLKEREETTHTLNSSPPENAKSFQDAVLNQRSANQKEIDKRIAEFDISDDEEDEMESEEAFPTKSRIKINFPKEKLKRIRQQYRGCLIIKLLGKNIGYKIFMDKISRLWSLEGLFVPIDLGLGFYLIRFETKADYTKVYTGGPWIIQDHYLTVRKWHNDYRADKATAIPTPVWMRFPLLPLEYYDEDIIMEIAGSLGKPIRVDNKTEASIRASFARVCVEIDLSQPLEPSVAIGKYDYSIEYEHIHLICFSCGRVGHRKENCSSSSESEKREEASNLTVNTTGAPDAKSVCYNGLLQSDDPTEIGLGEWMMVTRRNRRQPRALGPKNPEAQPNARHASSSNKAQSNTKPQAHKAHAPSPTTQSQPSISNPLQLQNRYQPVQQQTSIHNEVDQGLNPLASTPISPRSSGPAQKTSNSAHPNAKANLAQSRKGKGAISQQKNTPQPPKKTLILCIFPLAQLIRPYPQTRTHHNTPLLPPRPLFHPTSNHQTQISLPIMSLPEIVKHPIKAQMARIHLDPEREVAHLAEIAWWMNGVNLEILLNRRNVDGDKIHMLVVNPLRTEQQNRAVINRILGDTEISFEEDFFMTAFDILVWNCRGAGNMNFRRHFTALVQNHKPEIVALMETKVDISSMDMFFSNLGFTATSYVDPVGRTGGIWLLWDPKNVTVSTFHMTNQAIHATISKNSYEDWILSVLYMSPNPRNREIIWNELESMADNIDRPWAVAGDLNDIASSNERKSASSEHDSSRVRLFAERINKCKLIDLGCSGPKFTWTNNRKGLANIQKRLDRGLCNSHWRALFPEGMIQNLPRTYSDHSPFIIHVLGRPRPSFSRRPFRFEAAWLLDNSFCDLVNASWIGDNVIECISNFTNAVTNWNKKVFGNIFRKKRWLLGRIEGVQRSQEQNFSHNLQLLEKDLVDEYNNILAQEELHWYQKSRARWITQGERNTRFFHLTTIIRRRRANITLLKNDQNEWIDDPNRLRELVHNYFLSLFPDLYFSDLPHASLSPDDNRQLVKPVSNAEIWDTFKHIPAYKAPGPDGIQSIFYHKCWNIVGPKVCHFIKECFLSNSVPAGINETLIALIPKTDNPDNIKLFRPISLCNVIYKAITKILVTRIRPFLTKIISPFQSSFIPGRSTNDNILVTQEILHTLRTRKGHKGGFIFKIDLEKAYDKISWSFLKDTLLYFNFDPNWINLIMSCVTTSTTAILWNGEPLPSFSPGRGLRQGDPPFPLFVCAMYGKVVQYDFP